MNDAETKRVALDEFERLVNYISMTPQDVPSYQVMVGRYRYLKAFLTNLGLNMTDIDPLNL